LGINVSLVGFRLWDWRLVWHLPPFSRLLASAPSPKFKKNGDLRKKMNGHEGEAVQPGAKFSKEMAREDQV